MRQLKLFFALSLGLILAGCSGKDTPTPTKDLSLRFNDQGTFKIVQFTDTHICWENQEEYAKAVNQECFILDSEKPDLVVAPIPPGSISLSRWMREASPSSLRWATMTGSRSLPNGNWRTLCWLIQ